MKIIADLHIHSKYSRAVSKDMILENIEIWAGKKGIDIVGTGDFTHPGWFEEIKSKLAPAEEGLFRLKDSAFSEGERPRFMLTCEISSIYSKGGKTRRVHNLIFCPSIEAAEKINRKLALVGNLKSDGRPILGLDSRKLIELVSRTDSGCVLIPAHAWTPWFSVFGSMSSFDSLEECFEDMAPGVFAIETGLSSDPSMNRRLSALDSISLISNSDAHSLAKLGREANVFDCEMSYADIISAVKSGDKTKFLYTIEFFPEEGKYHLDGHRLCGVSFSPKETKARGGRCSKCGKPVTVGVLNRVEVLADRGEDYVSDKFIPHKNLIPLNEIISAAKKVGPLSKTVTAEYEKLIKSFSSEFKILIDTPIEMIMAVSGERVAEGIRRAREGKVKIIPGYDGEYGKISVFE